MDSLFWSIVRTLGRGRIARVDDSGAVQLVQLQLSVSETRDKTPRLAEYGFSSAPPEGCDAVAVFLAGQRTNGVVIACGSQKYRFRNLAPGEVSVSDDKGQSVHLSGAGIVVDGGGRPVTIRNAPQVLADTPLMRCTGDFRCDGAISAGRDITDSTGASAEDTSAIPLDAEKVVDAGAAGTSMAAMRRIYDMHTHDVAHVQGGGDTVKSGVAQPQQ